MAPLLHYLISGWNAKRRDIMDGLGAEARYCYFTMFRRDEDPPTKANAAKEFERLYTVEYGRKFYYFPGLLLCLSSLITVTLVVLTALDNRAAILNPLFNIPGPAIAALAGAYMAVVNDLVSRARRLDFSPSDVQWANLRLTIAIPMGYAFAAVAADSLAPFIAFALGAFPLAALNAMLRRIASSKLSIQTAEEESLDGLLKLQGVNKTIVERLANEDISTIPQLAYCDPIRLVMRSNLTFNFVMDCMNQALAWMYFEDRLDLIRPLGMRGAVEIKHLIDALDAPDADAKAAEARSHAETALPRIATILDLDSETRQIVFREIGEPPVTAEAAASNKVATEKARTQAALTQIAATLKQETATLETAFREIAGDPYTEFLRTIWSQVGTGEAET
jgi:hypothetical protein